MSESSFGFVEPAGTPTQYAGCVRALSKALGELADTREALERAEAMYAPANCLIRKVVEIDNQDYCLEAVMALDAALAAWRAGTQAEGGETGIAPTFRSDPG